MRVQNWVQLLHSHIDNAPQFEWGVNDCALWCADWIYKATGKDFASAWRGKYSSEETLRTLMQEQSFASIEQLADAHQPRISRKFAQRGDIVLHPQIALGICDGIYSYFLMESGKTRYETANCLAAWKV